MRLLPLIGSCLLLLTHFLYPQTQTNSQPAMPSQPGEVVVFWQVGFPALDTAAPSQSELAAAIPHATFADAEQLAPALQPMYVRLLVMPYGSTFPEEAWPAVYAYLERGGNLLAIGGRPFARAAYRDKSACGSNGSASCGKWQLRPERNAFMKKLYINDYTETPGSKDLQFQPNPDFSYLQLPHFSWNRAWSLTVKLSATDLYQRQGSAGSIDMRLDPLAWGVAKERRMAAPVIEIDHLQNAFGRSRWVLVPTELGAGFLGSGDGQKLVSTLAERAMTFAEEFTVRPLWALFLPQEPVTLLLTWRTMLPHTGVLSVEVEVQAEQGTPIKKSFNLIPEVLPYAELDMPPAAEKGFHSVTARLMSSGKLVGMYHTGFWIRDVEYLLSGPKLTVNKDFFELDGKPLPVVGSTYMASDVQRQYFMIPNPYVWEQDFADMQRNGVNMVRTGWWSGWDQVMKQTGVMNESSLRAIEAFLMTARRHNMPVQFNLFAFIPDVFGGENPYLDPHALDVQQTFVRNVVSRFSHVPWLLWDLINEPSFDTPKHTWATRANGDQYESALWTAWLQNNVGDNGKIAANWNTIPDPKGAPLPVPREQDFVSNAVHTGGAPLMAHDFYMFAQNVFVHWAWAMNHTIRSTGSKQLITIGQDEGGETDRLNPSYWVDPVDFTTNHTWWLNDALLWDSLAAKQNGKPLLIQETGLQNDFQIDNTWRRDPANQAALLEKKIALALGTSAGAIEWLWNVNAYMTEDNEVAIGMVRNDGTDKPDVEPFRALAQFAMANRDTFRDVQQPEVAILTSQSFQYSSFNSMAVQAQQKSVRVIHNYLRVPAYMVAENRIAELGSPKLLVVPSPMAMADSTWQALLKYAEGGGTVLITGSMERDPYWVTTQRLSSLGVRAERIDLNFRQNEVRIGEQTIPVSFADQNWIDALHFDDASTWKEITHGKGRLLVAALPVELAEGNDSTAAVYSAALQRAGVSAPFTVAKGSPGVLIRPEMLADAILYVFMSESGRDEAIDVTDKQSHARLSFVLPAQRTRLILLSKKDGRIIAKYGF